MTDKLRILLLTTDSLDQFYMRSGEEHRIIENRVYAGSHRDQFEVVVRPAMKMSDLIEELLRYDPQVVHLIADGRAGEGILLEDDRAEARAVGAQEMADLIRRPNGKIRLLFLSVCHTQEHARVISQDIDYVIGMRGEAEEETALALARHFYQALAYGKTVEDAFNIAINQLKAGKYTGADVPVLSINPGVNTSRPLFDLSLEPLEAVEPDPDSVLHDLGVRFASQLSIVGHLQSAQRSQQAIYLDSGLYVHRKPEEATLLRHVEQFARADTPRGEWVCVIGNAGHGKSSFLWYIYESLKGHPHLKVIPFLAQLEGHWSRIETTALSLHRSLAGRAKVIVIIDTLDILVGVADHALAAMLNSLRAAGCLLITTSRRQEAERLFSIMPSDHQIELKRFNDDEAQQAIGNFVNLGYYWLSTEARQRQIDNIWGILDQQRNVRELDLEPLILRMIFEAYIPDRIPRDVNTLQVYKRFWSKRVLLDHIVKTADERFTREKFCRLIARQIGFGGGHSDKLSVDLLERQWKALWPDPFSHTALEGLVSTGVLQWADGVSTIRFFHQTFFEYAVAYDLLLSEEPVIEQGVRMLLADVANYGLFRAPILKQFAIQAFEHGGQRGREVLQGLREINNEMAAQMALEITGKLPENDFSVDLCREWIETHGAKLQNVICETVKHYPSNKAAIALSLLEPYLEGPKAKVIYSICAETFAKDAPAQVCEFLSRFLAKAIKADDDEQKHYKEALCAALQYGAVEAFDILIELFPHLKPGQQVGLLSNIAEITTIANAEHTAAFLKQVGQLMPEVKRDKQPEVWDGVLQVACRLHEVSPATGSEFGRWLIGAGQWKQNQTAAMYTGMIIGPTVSDPLVVHQSLAAIASKDHFIRLLNTGLLSYVPECFSASLMDQILSLEKEPYGDEAQVGSLFSVVSSLKAIEPANILRFLGEWPWQKMGVGTPLRLIIEYLAIAGPAATKVWLFEQLDEREGPPSPKLFSAFSILLQASLQVFTPAEARHLYEIAFASSKTIRQIFAGATGSIANLDMPLAEEIFARVFTSEGKDCQVVAVKSLANCLQAHSEFVLNQAGRVLRTAMSTHELGILHDYLIIMKQLPRRHAALLLECLSHWFTRETLHQLSDNKTLGELLIILKIFAGTDPRSVFEFSKRLPLLNKGVAGGLASVYDQISKHTKEEALLLELLDSVAEVSKFDQVRMWKALRSTLRQLDQKLGGRKVVEAVLRTYKHIEDERSLKTFIDSALLVPSWTEEDTMTLLKDPDLPDSVRGLLASRTK